MKSKSDKFAQLMRSCREQRWSLSKFGQKLRRYYAEQYYVHQGRYYLDREQYRKGNRFYAVPGWIRDHVNDERWRRIRERKSKREEAQRQVQRAVARGKLKKSEHCEQCQQPTIKQKLQGHHRDYRYPLRVVWLCQSCHVKAQGKRAVIRAAWYAVFQEWRVESYQAGEQLRSCYKGKISRREYQRLRRELRAKYEQSLCDIIERFREKGFRPWFRPGHFPTPDI